MRMNFMITMLNTSKDYQNIFYQLQFQKKYIMEFIKNNIKIKPKINKKKKTNSTFDTKYGEMYNIYIQDTTNVELELKNVLVK